MQDFSQDFTQDLTQDLTQDFMLCFAQDLTQDLQSYLLFKFMHQQKQIVMKIRTTSQKRNGGFNFGDIEHFLAFIFGDALYCG